MNFTENLYTEIEKKKIEDHKKKLFHVFQNKPKSLRNKNLK